MENEGGDIVEQALAAAAIVEYLVITEEAVGEATEAAREALELVGEKDKEKKLVAVKATRKSVIDAFETAQKDAEQKGLSTVEQYAAGATAASKAAECEKAARDAVIAVKETKEAMLLEENSQYEREKNLCIV